MAPSRHSATQDPNLAFSYRRTKQPLASCCRSARPEPTRETAGIRPNGPKSGTWAANLRVGTAGAPTNWGAGFGPALTPSVMFSRPPPQPDGGRLFWLSGERRGVDQAFQAELFGPGRFHRPGKPRAAHRCSILLSRSRGIMHIPETPGSRPRSHPSKRAPRLKDLGNYGDSALNRQWQPTLTAFALPLVQQLAPSPGYSRMREKTYFSRPFSVMLPVQSLAQK